jgi:DNA repair exonuclease SbcCD ATPase subunit
MRNLLLLLILLAGGLAGYLIGDYRGKAAREALQEAVDKGNLALTEQKKAMLQLETRLRDIGDTHQQELEKIRTDYDAKSAEWRREKAGLTEKINKLRSVYAEKAAELERLIGQLDGVTGTAREALESKIERLQTELGLISLQIEGNACLGVRVPQSVHDALSLKMSNAIGGTQ